MNHTPFLAFVHIEKAAGQTFTRILENNFVYRHCRIAPLKREHQGVFQWADLKVLLKFNPLIEAFSGHSLTPYSDLIAHAPNTRFITIVRDPVKRYLSHYQYWVQALNRKISFDDFLSIEDLKDFQTKKIAGCPNLDLAKKVIDESFFLAGILEEFDAFLIVLRRKLYPQPFDIVYKKRNVALSNKVKETIYEKFQSYHEQIYDNNRLDARLYDYVKNGPFKREKEKWITRNSPETSHFSPNLGTRIKQEFIGRAYRNLYIGPIINFIRYKNGLRVGGSY